MTAPRSDLTPTSSARRDARLHRVETGFRAVDLTWEFPILNEQLYLNHAGVSPIPTRSARALAAWIEQARIGAGTDWPVWNAAMQRARDLASELLGASNDEIAFTHNTTHGLMCVANSLAWRPGDNIITAEGEFPANVHVWRNLATRGVACRVVPPRQGRFSADDFIARFDRRTRLLAISMVQYSNGFLMPVQSLAEACRERGILLCLDGIQAAGAMPINVHELGCDFMAMGGQKWLLASEGLGLFYIRKAVIDKMSDAMTGWLGRVRPSEYTDLDQPLRTSARRFEEGTLPMSLGVALEQSLGLHLEIGPREIWSRIEALTAHLAEGLRSAEFEIVSSRADGERSGIIVFRKPGMDPEPWVKELARRDVTVVARCGGLRASPHFYNTLDQMDELLDAVRVIDQNRASVST